MPAVQAMMSVWKCKVLRLRYDLSPFAYIAKAMRHFDVCRRMRAAFGKWNDVIEMNIVRRYQAATQIADTAIALPDGVIVNGFALAH